MVAIVRGQEGIGGFNRCIRGIETGYIMQFGYKEIPFHKEDNCLFSLQSLTKDSPFNIIEDPSWAYGLSSDSRFSLGDNAQIDNDGHWVLLAYPYADQLGWHFAIVDTESAYVDIGTNYTVTALPNRAFGYVILGWTYDGVDELADPNNPFQRTVLSSIGLHIIKVRPLLGWAITAGSSCTVPGYIAVSSGSGKGFTQNIGPPPVDHYHYDTQGHITHTCYQIYQWVVDSSDVPGANGSSYTVPAKTNGTDNHTVSVYFKTHCDYG